MYIDLTIEQRDTVLAALRWYQHSGMDDTDLRPNWLQALACPDGAETTSLGDADIDELCGRLHPPDEPTHKRLSGMARDARRRGARFFVLPPDDRPATYHRRLQTADNRAVRIRGTVYRTNFDNCFNERPYRPYRAVIDRTDWKGVS